MQTQNGAPPHHVVVIGAGFAGLQVVKTLAGSGARITLIDRKNYHLFQPLLYQVASTILSPSEIAWPIRRLMRNRPEVRTVMAQVVGVKDGRVLVEGGDPIPYDTLVLATGSEPAYFGHADWPDVAPGLKTLEDATLIRRRLLLALEQAEVEPDPDRRRALMTFAVIGGGPTGVELVGVITELAHRTLRNEFRQIDSDEVRVLLIEGGPRILGHFPESLSKYAQDALASMGAELRIGKPVTGLTREGVQIGEDFFPSATVIWAAGVAASPAAKWLGVAADRSGRIPVGPDLRVEGHPNVFVIGDLAAAAWSEGTLVPQLAPAAKQQGTHVGRTIKADLKGRSGPPPFRYRHAGNLATIGRRSAVVHYGSLRLTGALAWWIWGFAHILFLIGARNRIVVAWSWLWTYLRGQNAARLIVDPPDCADGVAARHPLLAPLVQQGATRAAGTRTKSAQDLPHDSK
ncbi:NAD(P)/FAD-dependent oxidoreductase [Pseudotabrizicola algicola]|uniref:NADH:ubiquinone reductase (non-electrogenic) n=1 Tax=Pseudotabrizicola algicola TaxID=2709381 RepID=A0A6B3S070_9RHOB|nr:NAD(P)/FAD-dependent oxidoreductase [Pseudotabrizicola algicola]NEX48782.1 NAD(P)/FAD-dependent oxidoreductase [Pseudotabrizicola algicola]